MKLKTSVIAAAVGAAALAAGGGAYALNSGGGSAAGLAPAQSAVGPATYGSKVQTQCTLNNVRSNGNKKILGTALVQTSGALASVPATPNMTVTVVRSTGGAQTRTGSASSAVAWSFDTTSGFSINSNYTKNDVVNVSLSYAGDATHQPCSVTWTPNVTI
ncbi:MAG: hypothetical protein ACJ72E_06710 [Marmoricola sp.]